MADERAEGMEPYLGLHFPASDIPTQARQLYITKLSRSIVRTDDPGIPLVAVAGDPTAIDLSDAELRAVSPYHLKYMSNMGQASTVSFSLIMDGELIGMITCAHRATRRLPVLLRRSLEVVASQLAMQLDTISQIDRLRHDVEVRERRAGLLAPLYASDDMVGTLLRGERTVLDLLPADGVALKIGDEIHTLGAVPDIGDVRQLMVAVGDTDVATHMLDRDRPDLAQFAPRTAGLIAVPLGAGNCVLFFRSEVTRVVNWLGDPGPGNRTDPLSPRLSFSAWQESVAGTAEPWGSVVDEALQLGRELQGALLRRAEARLAELAMHDALTGLRNRRYFAENLERALQDRVAPDSVSLLFVDLDDFKGINDTYGHDAGDAVIVEVGRRLVANSRTADAVARLGGDEFVVVCEHTTPEDARGIADRIVAAVGVPIIARGALVTVTASCGIVTADDATTGAALLEAADAAMYRAKAGGRNRVAG
jgi:two-component system, chemotaxis family, sensor kinase Cph1